MFKSQFKQDEIVNKYLNNKRNGFFVDIGAHNGIYLSNSYFFEKHMGWKGICIEPIPELYQELVSCRDCICIEGGAYNTEGKVLFNRHKGSTEVLSGIYEQYHHAHLDRINSEQYYNKTDENTFMQIQTYKLSNIFEKYNITYVDYITIDTEGSELQVLQGIDFDKVSFGILDLECNYESEFEPISNFLNSKGYVLYKRSNIDIFFIPK